MQTFPCVTSECICTPPLHLAWLHCHRTPSPRARVSMILSTSLPFNHLPLAQGLVAWQHVFQDALSAACPFRVYSEKPLRSGRWQRSTCVSGALWMCGFWDTQGFVAASRNSLMGAVGGCDYSWNFPVIPDLEAKKQSPIHW